MARFNVVPRGERFTVLDRRTGNELHPNYCFQWEADIAASRLNTGEAEGERVWLRLYGLEA